MTMDSKIVMMGIIIVFILFCIIYEFVKERSKNKKDKSQREEQNNIFKKIGEQLFETSSVNKELLRYLKISSQKYAEDITESQMRIVVESIFNNSQTDIYNYASKIIKENHIKGNEKEVTLKIKSFINNRYHKDTLLLKEFKYGENMLSNFLKTDWKDYAVETVLSCVLKEKGEKALQAALQNSFDSFTFDMVESILS